MIGIGVGVGVDLLSGEGETPSSTQMDPDFRVQTADLVELEHPHVVAISQRSGGGAS